MNCLYWREIGMAAGGGCAINLHPRPSFGVCRRCPSRVEALHLPPWEGRVVPEAPAKSPRPSSSAARGGCGTELKKLLALLGIVPKGCNCNAHVRRMDLLGPDWCSAEIEQIVGWLREEAAKRKLPFIEFAARLLVRRAIAIARKAAEPSQSS